MLWKTQHFTGRVLLRYVGFLCHSVCFLVSVLYTPSLTVSVLVLHFVSMYSSIQFMTGFSLLPLSNKFSIMLQAMMVNDRLYLMVNFKALRSVLCSLVTLYIWKGKCYNCCESSCFTIHQTRDS